MAANNCEVFQFKVTLNYTRPPIWRRIQVPSDYTFDEFHMAIQEAMGWRNCHLYLFAAVDPVTGRKVDIQNPENLCGFNDGETLPESTPLKRIFKCEKSKAKYEYDFGDGWDHAIVLEKIIPSVPGETYPKCVAGKKACPPEDCGGVGGYEDHVEILNNKAHPRYNEHMEWLQDIGYTVEPEDFNPKDVLFTYCRQFKASV